MVEHLPSSEPRRPIQKWEVTEIADAVESWYQQGTDTGQKDQVAGQRNETKQPQRSPASPAPQTGHEYCCPIQKEEVAPLVSAAEQLLSAGDEAQSPGDNLEDTIRALRIEEEILKYVPEVADKLRFDRKSHWVAAEQYRLLPHDAPEFSQRRWALWVYENLRHRLQTAQENGEPFTTNDVLSYYHQFQRRGLGEDAARSIAGWEQQHQSVDFTLKNLFAIAQRKLLVGYRLRDESENLAGLYKDTLTLHNLIEQAVEPEAPAITSESPSRTSG